MTDFRDLPINRGLEQALNHLNLRQRITAENVANASTPGYRARDVAAPDFGALVRRTEAAAGSGVRKPHVAKPRLGDAPERLMIRPLSHPDQATTDGNNVSLETEMLRQADTQARYATAASLYRRNRALMRVAIGRP